MKTKAAIFVPPELVSVLNSEELAQAILNRIGKGHLKLENPGPAEFYVQKSDEMIDLGLGYGCEVRMTGVSANKRRSTDDFWDALYELERIYQEFISENLPVGQKVQLFVVLMLDVAPFGENTGVLETQPVWIEGKATPKA